MNEGLPLMEHYYTIQGEGYNTGKACYFIRLGGCDVGCVWCDVKESWDAQNHALYSVPQISEWIIQTKSPYAVITGGEPLMYNLDALTASLHQAGVKTLLETSGAYALSGSWDWICVSPKKFKPPVDEILREADELKVVVYNKSDFDWAIKHAQKVKKTCKLFLQPEYSVFDKIIPVIIDFVKKNPAWRISLQTHKIMQIP